MAMMTEEIDTASKCIISGVVASKQCSCVAGRPLIIKRTWVPREQEPLVTQSTSIICPQQFCAMRQIFHALCS